MEQFVYFIHAPREDFGATMTDEEQAVWGRHFEILAIEEGIIGNHQDLVVARKPA